MRALVGNRGILDMTVFEDRWARAHLLRRRRQDTGRPISGASVHWTDPRNPSPLSVGEVRTMVARVGLIVDLEIRT